MKNIQSLAIQSVIYDNVSVSAGRDEMLSALRSDAAELAALRAHVEELERIAKAAKAVSGNLSKTEIIDIDGKDYNVWSIVGDAEKDELAAALKIQQS